MLLHDDLYYSESHEWIRIQDGLATIGLTDFAQSELGDIVFVELPDLGAKVSADEPCGSIEAVKAVEDIICPLSGVVEERNNDLDDKPDLINESPYEEGWLFKVRISTPEEVEKLMSALDYRRMVES
ncbi:MAG: glycine cleavage system protein GcvH [Candidatus Cloacimonetes bacterium]|nr:glycine cleavage system protein GcvH [Candidatus Cloacimonadota bacterium]NLK49079.1 glycine cleavage system protein GcvH [Candidatus Cloacimonadota bacterium]NLO12413.1 glycine cleavage system protein GcvH [Candidatus Cloacimonadota bacterium]